MRKLLSKLKVNVAMSDWRNDPLKMEISLCRYFFI